MEAEFNVQFVIIHNKNTKAKLIDLVSKSSFYLLMYIAYMQKHVILQWFRTFFNYALYLNTIWILILKFLIVLNMVAKINRFMENVN